MDFVVDKKDLAASSCVASPPLSLKEGDVLIKIEKFALTANNISYAATGDALKYWNFFPSSHGGRIPVWGTGSIVASRCENVKGRGQRVYGYFPMSQYVVMTPVNVNHSDFIDGSPHRKALPAVYNQYMFCEEDPFYTPRTEEAMIVLRPLFFTSWLLVDFFTQMNFCGAKNMIISSASSKTSVGLAFCLHQMNQSATNKIQIVGMTSPHNHAFCRNLGIYDQVILYDEMERQLDSSVPACFVDMAGNTKVTTRLHNHLKENMKYSCLVGAAHVGKGGKPTSKLPGARPNFFFAPSWTAKRIVELGGGAGEKDKDQTTKRRGFEVLLHNVLIDYRRFVDWCLGSNGTHFKRGQGWMHMEYYFGQQKVSTGYSSCLNGEVGPNAALIMSLWDSQQSVTATHSNL